MKRILLTLVAGTLSLGLNATIKGTKHDLSSYNTTWGSYSVTDPVTGVVTTSTGAASDSKQLCKFCHVAHGAQVGTAQVIPLWGHVTTSQAFTMYSSASMKGTPGTAPAGSSLACLSCHDGSIGVNARYSTSKPTFGTMSANFAADFDATGKLLKHKVGSGGDLTNSHPIDVDYAQALVNGSALNPVADILTAGLKLYNNKIQCASCHNPHEFNPTNGTLAGQGGDFLRISRYNAELCLTCHIK